MEDNSLQVARKLDLVAIEIVHRLKMLTNQEEELTGVQFFTLRLLGREKRLKVTDIASCLGVTLSAITGLINRLYKLNLVTREQDEADRRIVWVKLTSQGQALLNILNEKRAEKLASLLKELPQEDLHKLQEILQTVTEKLDQ